MEMKTIRIATTKKSIYHRVWALVEGNIAIHPTIGEHGIERKLYTITHVPTGLSFSDDCTFLSKRELPNMFNALRALNYNGVKAIDMPTCELVNIAPVLHRGDGSKMFTSKTAALYKIRMREYADLGIINC